MKFLLYCIVSCSGHKQPETLAGVNGQPVSLIVKNGVAAAVSKIGHAADYVPDISQILEYKKVVETLHDSHTVIPMRYGCLFENERQIIRMLEGRGYEYQVLLLKLEGCMEMSIRVLIENCGSRTVDLTKREENPIVPNLKAIPSGRAYLATIKGRYAQHAKITEEMKEVSRQCRSALSGLFVQCKEEYLPPPNPQTITPSVYSLYFLVSEESVDRFREKARCIRLNETMKFLLSGPWPPYNFVQPDFSLGAPDPRSHEQMRDIQ